MIPMRMRNNNRFFLRVRNRGSWLKQAGTRYTSEGETAPVAETTRRFSEAQSFETWRRAARMRDLLAVRYGIKTEVIRFDGGWRYDY